MRHSASMSETLSAKAVSSREVCLLLKLEGAHRDFSTTSHSSQFHTQVKLQHRRFTLVKLQRATFAASMQKQLPKLTTD